MLAGFLCLFFLPAQASLFTPFSGFADLSHVEFKADGSARITPSRSTP